MVKKMVVLWIIGVVLGLILILFLVRAFSHKEIDDVSPGIFCEDKYMEKADVLWVIPRFKNKSIADDKEWCDKIKSMGKKLGLHGVNHTYKEFNEERSEEYLQEGIGEFEKCFGFKPAEFKVPQLFISGNNVKLVESKGMKVKGWLNQITHKVYHCNDDGVFPNWFIGLF